MTDIDTIKTSQVDPDGNVVKSFTEGFGRTISTIDQLSQQSISEYDSGGNLLKSINALDEEA